MSNISTVYNAIITRLEILLPSHERLPNPIDVEENDDSILRKGFGLRVIDDENTKRNASCRITLRQGFVIVFARDFMALENNSTLKAQTQLDLLEDKALVVNDFEAEGNLGTSGLILITDYVGSAEPAHVFDNKDNFLKLESTFTVEYFKQL